MEEDRPVLINVLTSPFAFSSCTSRDRRPISAKRSSACESCLLRSEAASEAMASAKSEVAVARSGRTKQRVSLGSRMRGREDEGIPRRCFETSSIDLTRILSCDSSVSSTSFLLSNHCGCENDEDEDETSKRVV